MTKTFDNTFMRFPDPGYLQSWSTSAMLRWVPVDIITFEHDFCETDHELAKQCDMVASFVLACQRSLNLISEIDPAWYPLELYIVRQYMVVVCVPFYEWAERRRQNSRKDKARKDKMLEASLGNLKIKLKEIMELLEQYWNPNEPSVQRAADIAERWLVMTIFHPVVAALAKTFDAEKPEAAKPDAFMEHIRKTDRGIEWVKTTQQFRPNAILMNFTDRIVATSMARWSHKKGRGSVKPFVTFEKQVRAAGMAARPRKLLREARIAMLPLSTKHDLQPDMRWSDALEEGLAAMRDAHGRPSLFTQYCGGKAWMTVYGRTLQHFDPCPACRIKYAEVHLIIPNEAEWPVSKVGDNWGEKEEWDCGQCAEDEMFAQLYLTAEPRHLGGVYITTIVTEPALATLRQQVEASWQTTETLPMQA